MIESAGREWVAETEAGSRERLPVFCDTKEKLSLPVKKREVLETFVSLKFSDNESAVPIKET
jgi:hypothetical protein